MGRALYRSFPFLVVCSIYAQTPGAEAPVDKASGLTVVIFLLLFAGSCVGYFAYVWWTERKRRQLREGEKTR
jgi:hypothetical protein